MLIYCTWLSDIWLKCTKTSLGSVLEKNHFFLLFLRKHTNLQQWRGGTIARKLAPAHYLVTAKICTNGKIWRFTQPSSPTKIKGGCLEADPFFGKKKLLDLFSAVNSHRRGLLWAAPAGWETKKFWQVGATPPLPLLPSLLLLLAATSSSPDSDLLAHQWWWQHHHHHLRSPSPTITITITITYAHHPPAASMCGHVTKN